MSKKKKDEASVIIVDPYGQASAAAEAFAARWISLPALSLPCQVMDAGQLRDAMGIRATIDNGDAWPLVEKILRDLGFTWHLLGGTRVMYLRDRGELIDTEWQEAREA